MAHKQVDDAFRRKALRVFYALKPWCFRERLGRDLVHHALRVVRRLADQIAFRGTCESLTLATFVAKSCCRLPIQAIPTPSLYC